MSSLVKSTVLCAVVALFFSRGFAVAQPPQSAAGKPKAAVYIKGNPPGRDVLRMAVNTFLVKTGMYQMIAVDAIDLLAQEHVRQMSGTVSDNEIARLGRDAGAQYVCVVERSEMDGISYVTTSMVSVQSKIAEFSDMKELPRGERIISLIERQINAMLGIATVDDAPEAGYESASAPAERPSAPASLATYLYVDGKVDVSVEFDRSGGTKTFRVSTDADGYSISDLPRWCSAAESGELFSVACSANPGASERREWFRVFAGGRSVVVNVRQSGSRDPSASAVAAAESRARRRAELDAIPFEAGNVYVSARFSEIDSRDGSYVTGQITDTKRSSTYIWFGAEDYGPMERNTFGGGIFGGGGYLGDGYWGFILGGEVKDMLWVMKRYLAVPISFGFDWRPLLKGQAIPKYIAKQFIPSMSDEDQLSDEKMDMSRHYFDFTPGVGVQIFMGRKVSLFVGYAYNLTLATDWAILYKVPSKYYSDDSNGDAFRVPDRYAPLQKAKESLLGVPGSLRVDLKFHTKN